MADDHWRHTANEVKIGVVDAKSGVPFPLLLVIKSWFLFGLGIIFVIFFFILNTKGLNFPNFQRKFKVFLTGHRKEVQRMR